MFVTIKKHREKIDAMYAENTRLYEKLGALRKEADALASAYSNEMQRANRITVKLLNATKERDALQAKIDKMRSGLKQYRSPTCAVDGVTTN